jgi:hypothetical protein
MVSGNKYGFNYGEIKMPFPKVGNKKRSRRMDGAWRKKRSDAGKKRRSKI